MIYTVTLKQKMMIYTVTLEQKMMIYTVTLKHYYYFCSRNNMKILVI